MSEDQISRRINKGTYSAEELKTAGFDEIAFLLVDDLDGFFKCLELKESIHWIQVDSSDHLVQLFIEGVDLKKERQRLTEEAQEVYEHELEHKKAARDFGISSKVYFRRNDVGKHDVFVDLSIQELKKKYQSNLAGIIYFFYKVLLAPSIKGKGGYEREEKIAQTLKEKYSKITRDKGNFEPLPE